MVPTSHSSSPGLPDRGHAQHARGTARKGDRIAANQRQRVAFARRFDPAQESFLPIVRPGYGQRQQRATWGRALGSEVREVHRDQLPADAGGRIGGKEMHALRDGIMRDDEPVEHRRIVEKPASGGIGRHPADSGDDFGFAHQPARAGRACFAIASSSPLTNPLSRLS